MVRTFQEHNCVISKRIFCLVVEARPSNVSEALCDGILKRIFSKQICFTYRIEAFVCEANSFRIYFRFVCWNSEGQRIRYKKFRNMPLDKLEENIKAHSRKTIDNFIGEFFKRLKRAKFLVEIDGQKVNVYEDQENQVIPCKANWKRQLKAVENEE